jgi:hypothetical protein
VCLCTTDIISGQRWQIWADDQPKKNPLPDGPDILYVCYSAQAENSYFLASGWDLPRNILDLYAVHKQQANGYQEFRKGEMRSMRCSLLGMMAENGLASEAYTVEQKDYWRKIIMRGEPYTEEEKQGILDYCSADERDLQLLLPKLLPTLNLDLQLLLGDFTRVLGWVDYNGIPVDAALCRRLAKNWPAILEGRAWHCEEQNSYGVFRFDSTGAHLDQKLYADLIEREGLAREWPRSATGKFSTSISNKKKEQPNLRTMAHKNSRFKSLFETVEMLQNYKQFELSLGPDGRWRSPNTPWEQKTGRVSPRGASLFRMHSWFRNLIMPPPGRAVAYVDLMSAEYGIGGLLSGDKLMTAAYIDTVEGRAESPYLITGMRIGMIPQHADKKHPQYRICKAAELGMMYGQGPKGCSDHTGISLEAAEEFHAGHRRIYRTYWEYIEWRIHRAYIERRMTTPLGFCINVNRDVKSTTLQNWPNQATCAEIMRLATTRMVDEGLSICSTVHDAVLIEADDVEIEKHVEKAKECWRWAGERVVKFPMEADSKIVRSGQHYVDDDGKEAWEQMMELLARVEKEQSNGKNTCGDGDVPELGKPVEAEDNSAIKTW